MPASQTGFGDFFLGRNANMPLGYQMSVLGCAPGMQPAPHLAAIAGVPLTFPGLQGYNFIPYPQSRHMGRMNNSYDVKAPPPYLPGLLGRGASFYPPYRPVAAEDPSRLSKVATRESTSALKAWLNEHLKNPYPTKGEKIMLAIVTKMSLTQVSTWFANARRRLKKENRVSWASKGKSDEEEEDSEGECSTQREQGSDDEDEIDPETVDEEVEIGDAGSDGAPRSVDVQLCQGIGGRQEVPPAINPTADGGPNKTDSVQKVCKGNTEIQKPKIWSLAETATSDTEKKPQDWGHSHQSHNEWWVHWASRNGPFFPISNSTHDILRQSVCRDLNC